MPPKPIDSNIFRILKIRSTDKHRDIQIKQLDIEVDQGTQGTKGTQRTKVTKKTKCTKGTKGH